MNLLKEIISVNHRNFELLIPENEILEKTREIATQINRDFRDKNPVFLAVLNGSFMFASDLLKEINIPCRISFVKLQSYRGTESTGIHQKLLGLEENLTGEEIIIIEDIIDTGITIKNLFLDLENFRPKSVSIASLLLKPEKLKVDIKVDYLGFKVKNDFLLGYGLDFDGWGRNLKDIYKLIE